MFKKIFEYRFEITDIDIPDKIMRPWIKIEYYSFPRESWYSIDALADTGADYSLLPLRYGRLLVKDIKLGKYDTLEGIVPDCPPLPVYYHSLKCRINRQEFMIRVGISECDNIWPIFGRTLGLNRFDINFLKGTKCVFKW